MKGHLIIAAFMVVSFAASPVHAAEKSSSLHIAFKHWREMHSTAHPRDPLNPTYKVCELGYDDYNDLQCTNWDAVILCGHEDMFEGICAINTPQGITNVPYDKMKVEDHGGHGQCGEPGFEITCHRPLGTQVLYDTQRLHAVSLSPGESNSTAALSVCKKYQTKNYGVFLVWDQGGGGNGFSAVDAICYK